ncbi:MAG: hypothetical protein QGH45_12920 [Myxococcota bacterium]|jgi:predicted secreted protein|nr:hypothetical protein [Myxococcota bacterium]
MRPILHAAIWLGSAGLWVLLPLRFARVLALDYEALFCNLAEGYPARIDTAGLAAGARWIELGSAPLFVLLFASLAYRLTRRWGLANPLGRPGWVPAAALCAVSMVCWHLFAMPAAHALAVWAQVEAFAWIQWADNVPAVMDWLRLEGPRYALIGIDVTGALGLLLALALRGGETGAAPVRWRMWARRALTVTVVVAGLVAAAPAGSVFVVHGGRIGTATGMGVFADTCGQCHVRSRPLFFVKTPAEWRTTLARMRSLEGAPLDEEEAEQVLAFLCGMRSFSDRWIFRTRCQRCHRGGTGSWGDRPVEDWARVVDRMARWSPHYYRPQIREQLVSHLERTRSAPDATLGLDGDTYRSFASLDAACSPCHSVARQASRVVGLSADERRELLQQMERKRPVPWSAAELETLAAAYDQLLADEALRTRVLPHDRPVSQGELPW